MKKTIFLCLLLTATFWEGRAQVLDQSAGWPNAAWALAGTYDPNGLMADPTTSANFSFDDDAASSSSIDAIYAESGNIDLTAAHNAGETWLKVSLDYTYNLTQDSLEIQYYDADTGLWSLWPAGSLPDNATASTYNCGNTATNFITEGLDISGFSAAQLSGFRYRIAYDDNGGWLYGFCINSPTLFSELPPSCLKPSDLNAENITASSADLTWAENGTANNWDIEMGIVGDAGFNPTGFPNFPNSSMPQNISILTPNTTYAFYVRANCGGGDVSEWEGPYNFKTPCSPSSAPFSEGFEVQTGGNIADCWSMINQGDSNGWGYTSFGNPYEGSVVAYVQSASTDAHDDYLISPNFSVAENSNRFTFHSLASTPEQFNVLISTTEADEADFSLLEGPLTGSPTWEEHNIDLSAYEGQNVYIAIQSIGVSPINSYLLIDGVVVDAMPSCPKPSGLNVTDLTATSATLGWTDNGSAMNWDIQWGIAGFVPFGINAPNSSNPQTIEGLTAGSSYDFYVRANCGSGDVSEWVGPFTFTTLCNPNSGGFLENFTDLATGEAPECWRTLSSDEFSFIGAYSSAFTLQNNNNPAAELFAITPPLGDLPSGTYQMRFQAATSANATLEIGTFADPTDPTTFTSVRTLTGGTPGYYSEYIVPFGTTTDMQIGFRATFDDVSEYVYIDQVYWELAPSCIKPTGLQSADATVDGADLSWMENGDATNWEVYHTLWENPAPTAETIGTAVSDNSYSISDLSPGSLYKFYVRADCGSGDKSEWSNPANFMTLCDIYSDPFTEGFEISNGSIANCWSVLNFGDPNSWNFYISPSNPYEGMYVAGIQTYSSAHDDYLISPQIAVTENTNRFSFQTIANSPEQFKVLISTTGKTATDFSLLEGPITAGTEWEENAFDLSAYEGQNVYVAIQAISQFQSYLYVDGVVVDAMPSCPDPSDLTVTNLTATSAFLGWTENGSTNAWDIEWGIAGFVPTGTPTNSEVDSNPFPLTDLTTNTGYEFYVRANCGDEDVSQWVGPYAFTTLCEPFGAFTENFDGTTIGDMPNCWNAIVNSTNENTLVQVVNDSGGTSSPNTLRFYSQDMAAEVYAITPMLTDLPTGVNKLRFQAYTPSIDPNTLEIGTMSDPMDPSTFTVVQSFAIDQGFQEYEVVFSDAGDSFIAFRTINLYYSDIIVDDVVWEPLGACAMPIDLTVSSITTTSADFSWMENGFATTWDIEVVPAGSAPTGTPTYEGVTTNNSFTIDELTAATDYDLYVRADCESGNTSDWAGPVTFMTECEPFSLPVCENFDTTPVGSFDSPTIPNCWSFIDTGLGYGYVTENGDFFLYNSYNGTDYILVSPEIPSLGSGNNWIQFDVDANQGYQLIVGTMSDPTDASTFTPIETLTLATNEFETHSVIVPSGTDAYIAIKHGNLGAYRSFAIDNICIEEIPVDYIYSSGSWTPMDPNGNASYNDNILINNGTTSFTEDITMNSLTVATGATLMVEQALTVNSDIVNNGSIVFVNDETKLGQLGDMTGIDILGDGEITVERHIPARSDDSNGAYRFLSSAVNSTGSIHDNWQEGASSMGNPNPGYGMFITGEGGAANGFDATPANAPSLFTFDNDAQVYVEVGNTDGYSLTAGQPFSVYVWGDRSVDILTSNDPPATSTTLRATGSLTTGNWGISGLSSAAGGFDLIGNPYQAIVDMNLVLASASNINTNFYYVWDPNLGTRGAYATVNLAGASTVPSPSEANQYVMPGQAVWVATQNAGAASLTFEESDKAVTADPTDVFRTETTETASIELQLFRADRFANGQSLSDAVSMFFSETGDNAVLSDDAPKLPNMDENLARKNGDDLLSIENRAMPVDGEVLPLYTDQYGVADYVFNALVEELPADTQAYLLDNYLGTQVELVNGQATAVAFSVDAGISASAASDRFSIVFERNGMGVNDSVLSGLSIYPNPVENGEFFIAASGLSGEKVQVNLYNILGQKVYVSTETVNANEQVRVPVSSLEAGVYLVEMNHNGKTFTGKVMVE